MNGRLSTRLCLVFLLCPTIFFAAPPTIGIASAIGSFIVNSNRVDGNANLFEGSELKTGKASSQIFLQNGAALILGIESSGTVYRDHLLLQAGATKVDNMNGFGVHASGYRIEQAEPASQVVVRLTDDAVQIAALSGSLNVVRDGALLTRIGTGTAAAFQRGARGGGQGTPGPNVNNRRKKLAAEALLLAATLTGLGLAVAAIVQPSPTSQ